MATFLFIVGALCMLDARKPVNIIAGVIAFSCALILSGSFDRFIGVCS